MPACELLRPEPVSDRCATRLLPRRSCRFGTSEERPRQSRLSGGWGLSTERLARRYRSQSMIDVVANASQVSDATAAIATIRSAHLRFHCCVSPVARTPTSAITPTGTNPEDRDDCRHRGQPLDGHGNRLLLRSVMSSWMPERRRTRPEIPAGAPIRGPHGAPGGTA